MKLRPYQQAMCEAVVDQLGESRNRVLLQAATGTGKTVTFASLIDWPEIVEYFDGFGGRWSVLIIAHREELLDQSAAKILAINPSRLVGIEQGDRWAARSCNVVIASIQTLAASKFRRLFRLMQHHTFRLVIVDECFPPGTIVDGRAIETLAVGDYVSSFDPRTGRISRNRIVRVLRKPCDRLLEITTSAGVLVCTPRHKLWTADGWKRAHAITAGDRIGHHETETGDVSSVRTDVHRDEEEPMGCVSAQRPDVLLTGTSGPLSLGRVLEADGRDKPAVCIGSDARLQSNGAAGVAGENAVDLAGDEASAFGARGQRATGSGGTAYAGPSIGLADRGCGHDGRGLQTASLQDRHCESGGADRDRGGRSKSRDEGAAGSGSAERRLSTWARVDGVAVLEPGRDGRFERVCPGGEVFDLEVETDHTYFANGFAVSNCHHAAAPTYRTALAHLGFLPVADVSEAEDTEAASFDDVAVMTAALEGWDAQAPKDRILVGVTATPNRSDEVGLACVFQSLAFSYPMKDAIRDGWLTRIRPYVIESDVNLDAVKMSHGDFNQKSLAEAVNREARNQLAVAGWQEKGEGRPTIAFTVDVAHAHAIAEAFRTAGVRAVALSGETPKDERRGILRRFQAGEIDLIANCMVLTEGTDLPVASCLLHLKPTKSATLYEQMTGRVLRPHPDDPVGPARLEHVGTLVKPYAIVIDVVDVTQRHSLMTSPALQGLPPGLATDGDLFLDEVGEAVDDLRELYPGFDVAAALASGRLTLDGLRHRAREFDIFRLPDLGALASLVRLRWKKLTDESYLLSYPWGGGSWTETVEATKQLIGWTVTLERHATREERDRLRAAGKPIPEYPKRVIAENMGTPQAALRAAEAFIAQERRSAMTIVDGRAPWRQRPATEKQIKRLESLSGSKKKGIRVPTLTSGEASDLIDLLIARKQRELSAPKVLDGR